MKVSVALAAYHGEAYLAEQLQSILPQLGEADEVLVSDDAPGGETQRIVQQFALRDPRVRYLAGPGQGVCANYEHALRHCTGDILFLCDQDDVWLPQKVQRVKNAFVPGVFLVLHDAVVTDANLKTVQASFFQAHGQHRGLLANIVKNTYIGCCIAIHRSLLELALPFPENLPMHDWWLGLLAEASGGVAVLHEQLLLYRRHDSTVTGRNKNSFAKQLRWRLGIAGALLRRLASRCAGKKPPANKPDQP